MVSNAEEWKILLNDEKRNLRVSFVLGAITKMNEHHQPTHDLFHAKKKMAGSSRSAKIIIKSGVYSTGKNRRETSANSTLMITFVLVHTRRFLLRELPVQFAK
jgi:hypothetical protein